MNPEPHPDCYSPKVGFWPDPTREAFRRLQEPSKKKNSASIIYNYEEETFYFSGSNITPIFNRFECLSDETHDNKSDSECISDFVYKTMNL